MAVIRPAIDLTNGRVQMPLRVNILDVLVGNPIRTFLTSDTAVGATTLTVQNISGFAVNQVLLIGQPGLQNSEIIHTHASSAPSGSTITLASATLQPHSASSFVYIIPFDQLEFSISSTEGGSKSVLATTAILANQQFTEYNDITNTSGYYYARFKNTISSSFSTYSSSVLYAGYGLLAVRAIIDAALQEINKQKSDTLSDVFFYTQIDNCQTEVIQMLKRWSFMQLFDQTVGNTDTGSWKFTMPANIGIDTSNKSVYQLRVATQQRLTWVDKEKFDEFLVGVAYTTLALPANNGDLTLTLTDSSSFNSLASQTQDGTGTVTIGANTYSYSANDTSTGVLTLSDAVTTDTTAPAGADVFQGATQGLPQYWTTYGGIGYYWPIAAQSYNGFQLLMDYYTKQLRVTDDNTNIVLPDPTVVINYLCWKALKRLNNGEDNEASLAYNALYISRRETMRIKEVTNTTFKLRPRIQNFAIQSEFNESTPRWVRDANFPNTGF